MYEYHPESAEISHEGGIKANALRAANTDMLRDSAPIVYSNLMLKQNEKCERKDDVKKPRASTRRLGKRIRR